jgi:hypothetical protein
LEIVWILKILRLKTIFKNYFRKLIEEKEKPVKWAGPRPPPWCAASPNRRSGQGIGPPAARP